MEELKIIIGINILAYVWLIAWRLSDIRDELRKTNNKRKWK